MRSPDDTIVALATPPGRGGVAIVRLSGPRSRDIARGLVEGARELTPRHATLVRVVAPSGDGPVVPIDDAITTFFPSGSSYTGEDVVEFAVHGSPVIVGELIDAACALGARMARPGEFTLRAFLGGRLDLTGAEAVRDLVEATTPVQARVAFDQLRGGLAERIGEIERALFDLVSRLQASGDFPEEGYHFITPEETRVGIETIRTRIDRLLADARRGRLIREGVAVAIVGRPNVGKSTLFNRLAGAERAIVTAVPGTTRDVLVEAVMLLGTRMILADTAGVRATTDPIEREGVRRAEQAGAAADVVVIVLDGTLPLADEDYRVIEASAGRTRVIAVNKSDRAGADWAATGDRGGSEGFDASEIVHLSALTGAGVDALVGAIARVVGLERLGQTPENNIVVTNSRHVLLLGQTAESLSRAAAQLCGLGHTPEEIVLSDLREATEALEEVTGRRTTDALLDAIFSRFCVGK